MDRKTALNVFKSMTLPYLEYGNGLLLDSHWVDVNRLQMMQNRGLILALSKDLSKDTKIIP